MEISPDPRQSVAWKLLEQHVDACAEESLAQRLDDPARFGALSVELDGLCVDFSRMRATPTTLELLSQLANDLGLPARIDELFAGVALNNTEDRAALHTSLRAAAASGPEIDGCDVAQLVRSELDAFLDYAERVREGRCRGSSNEPFRTVVNIGIGGSDLGPRFVTAALGSDGPDVRFVAAMDGIELRQILESADPATTLFVVCSKTFTTLETLTNATTARDWLAAALGRDAVPAHFAAVSVNATAMDDFGIGTDARFAMWDWVGGRYSVWSPVGLSLAIAIGAERFRALHDGARVMDEHFRTTPVMRNIPALHGLLAVWQQNFLGLDQHLVLPYDERLTTLPSYLQQLWMESLGKAVRRDGTPVQYPTGASLWGNGGSCAQHSFAQWLHQGSAKATVDYVGTVNGADTRDAEAHLQSLANMLAQADVLARGRAADAADGELGPHRAHPGNRPSTLILLRRLTPQTLGMLLALYEHSVFVQSVIWGINPFDQYGVEQGKAVARQFADALAHGETDKLRGAARRIRDWRD